LDDVGRELREQMSGEFRLAAEEDEYWAMKQSRRAGTMAEIAYDSMNRGDLVEVLIGKFVFRGHIRHTRKDLLVLSGSVQVDVNLAAPLALRVVATADTGGVGGWSGGAESFTARLAELEQSEEICEFLAVPSEVAVTGQVSIRARDHVIVDDADGSEWVLPIRWLAAVVHRSAPPPVDR
jgi:hypothetical protein